MSDAKHEAMKVAGIASTADAIIFCKGWDAAVEACAKRFEWPSPYAEPNTAKSG
jgi:hypothetical protein